ncbi:hypothetical protein F8S20_23705 [Nostoc sp. BAE]|nr:hypothetical protein [Nostoc commune BAE]
MIYEGENRSKATGSIAVPIQMRYNIILLGVGARQCRAPTDLPHINENRYAVQFLIWVENRSQA